MKLRKNVEETADMAQTTGNKYLDAEYESQNKVDWYRVPVDPKLLQELNHPSDVRGLAQALGHLGLVTATGIGVFYVWLHLSWWYLIPALLIHGACHTMLHAGVHELVHERVFRTRFLNRFFLNIYAFLNWWNHPFFGRSHKEHHRFTLNPPDDLEVVLPQTITFTTFIRNSIFDPKAFLQMQWSHVRMLRGIPAGEWQEYLFEKMGPAGVRRCRRWAAILLIGHAAIAAAAIVSGFWIIAVIVSLGSSLGGFIAQVTGAPQHAGLVDKVNDFRLNCRTYRTNFLFEFLYWNMNFHIEHHMYAAVPCYNLARLHNAIKHELPPVHQNLLSTWAEIFFIVFRQRNEPDYQYVQPIPGLETTDTAATVKKPVRKAVAAPVVDDIENYKVWECTICGFIYDEALGLPEEGIAPGTRWDDIPDDWNCPDCGVAKADFHMIERKRKTTPGQKEKSSKDELPVVILGAGLAGYQTAEEFRKLNPLKSMVIITRDNGDYYYKPNLSTAAADSRDADDLVLQNADAMAEKLNTRILTRIAVTSIDREKHLVVTDNESIAYDKLVLALGADPVRLPFEGSGAADVLRVNDIDDYRALHKQLSDKRRVLLIGAGLIGAEFADSLSTAGHRVTLVDSAPRPLAALTPRKVGERLRQALEAKGVDGKFGATVKRIDKAGDFYRCHVSDGSAVDTDVVLSAVGLTPRIALADQAGLRVRKGIVVNKSLQTSDPDILAMGDCAEIDGQVRPYVLPIRKAAPVLAKVLDGGSAEIDFPVMPVQVKTPSCPIIAIGTSGDGDWEYDEEETGLSAEQFDEAGSLSAVVLCGTHTERLNRCLDQIGKTRKVSAA